MKRIFMGISLALTAGCMEQPQNSQTAEFAALATPSECKVPPASQAQITVCHLLK